MIENGEYIGGIIVAAVVDWIFDCVEVMNIGKHKGRQSTDL